MLTITIKATVSPKFIRVTDVLTPQLFGPRDVKLAPSWVIEEVGSDDHDPGSGRIDIEVARKEEGPYYPYQLDMPVKNNECYPVDDSTFPKPEKPENQ